LTCNSTTGECIDCNEYTDGVHCEICREGFYGAPSPPDNIPCKACPCPNTKASGHSFADACYLDKINNEPVCECYDEYTGTRCNQCADNYYGNPEMPNGECVNCDCNENWKQDAEGNCDPNSGVCLKCIFDTEGDHCEHCKAGFFGNAVGGMCSECECNMLGTDQANYDCDRVTGKCNCLPNVIGDNCDNCEANHWGLARGTGCDACDCDPVGSCQKPVMNLMVHVNARKVSEADNAMNARQTSMETPMLNATLVIVIL